MASGFRLMTRSSSLIWKGNSRNRQMVLCSAVGYQMQGLSFYFAPCTDQLESGIVAMQILVVGCKNSSDPASKIMVISSRLLSDAHRYIMRCLSALQNVRQCAVYTSISEVAHSAYPDSPLGPDAFHEYESLLNQDYVELVKKREIICNVPEKTVPNESSASEEGGWSELSEIDDDISEYRGVSNAKPPLSTGKLADAEEASPGANLTAQFLYHLALKVREVQEAIARSRRPNVEVTLSGTTFLTPHNMHNLVV